jgi:hypothetical protein
MSVVSIVPLSFSEMAWTALRFQVMVSPMMISVGSGYNLFTPRYEPPLGGSAHYFRDYRIMGFLRKMAVTGFHPDFAGISP